MTDFFCWLCNGTGGWEDPVLQQSVLCPICQPQQTSPIVYPDRIPGYDFLQAKYLGPSFENPPDLLVIHRGEKGNDVAGYFQNPGDDREVSAHFAYHKDRFVQCCPLHRVAWHCGGSELDGDHHLNFRSLSIEAPGDPSGNMDAPYPADVQLEERALLLRIKVAVPSIVACVGHHDIDPENRQDPGAAFPWVAMLQDIHWKCPHT